MTTDIDALHTRLREIQDRCVAERDRLRGSRGKAVSAERTAIRTLRLHAEALRRELRAEEVPPEQIATAMIEVEKQYDETIGRRDREERAKREAMARADACSVEDD